jgi:hypothetical protein
MARLVTGDHRRCAADSVQLDGGQEQRLPDGDL